jgi:non-haem Fe2+, alpha-ketoglutarate-dependent halogenase
MQILKPFVDFFNYIVVLICVPLKYLPATHRFLPERLRAFVESWDLEMMRAYITSYGKTIYMDQRASFIHPDSYQPLIQSDLKYRLSEEQIQGFYDNGFIGPFTICSPEEMSLLREEIDQQIRTPSDIYDHPCGRDRHLDCEAVQGLVTRPELTERLAQILGPDLGMWRSGIFRKESGAPETTWHQANTYLMEEGYKPTLFPPDLDRIFQLTTWIALDDVDIENGCLQFVPGSHKQINKMTIGGKGAEGFANVQVKIEAEIDPKTVYSAEMKAGQCIIFTERVIHGAQANLSNRRRWGMTFRTVRPDVKVYDDKAIHKVKYLKKDYDTRKWGMLMLRGEDRFGVNPIYQKPATNRQANQEKAVAVPVLWN